VIEEEFSTKWYVAGLHFQCAQCGGCCAGPNEGYIWVTAQEIAAIAEFLKLPIKDVRNRFMRNEGRRTTIIEEPKTKDCIFLQTAGGQRGCSIYTVRPNQCRTWPFWPGNLSSPEAWNRAAQRCPGINRGRLYDHDEIERLKD
jgi:uncharacterized protein